MSDRPTPVPPTEEELQALPFDFTNLEVYQHQEQRSLFADWISGTTATPVQKLPGREWQFYKDNKPIDYEHWVERYPGLEHVEELTYEHLEGQFRRKNVHWSRIQNCWVYGNNRPTDFNAPPSRTPTPREPSPSSTDEEGGNASDEEAQVTEILDRTKEALAAAASTLRQQSAPPTPQTTPGGLPTTPVPSTSWASLFPTPASDPRQDTPPRLPSREPSPSRFRTPPQGPPSPVTPPDRTPPLLPQRSPHRIPSPRVLTIARVPLQVNPPVTNTMSARPLGAAPEPFDGKAENAENFWTTLEAYYFLNEGIFNDDQKKIITALTYFKAGTSAAEWARERQKAAFVLNPTNFGTWATFKADFSAHFIPAESVLESTQKMHNMQMGSREFNEWYQEWSTHAARSGADEHTKMYAFRRAINQALHVKLLGVSPQLTTMAALVEKAREFDRLWRVYGKNTTRNDTRSRRTRAVTTAEEGSSTQINYANLEAAEGKLTKAEKDRRYKEKLCFYCGKSGHMARECRLKKGKNPDPRNKPRRDAKARAVTTQETEDEKASPPYEDQSVSISRIYPANNRFEIIRPASAPNDLDF
jgi:retrotransposon gag protein/zinc knuckle protein